MDLVLIPTWNFERKLKMMLNLCYLLHLFRILAITFYSKFQLIWNRCILKWNSILDNFSKNKENQISIFSRPKMQFKLLLKIVTFFEHFSCSFFFLKIFIKCIFFSIQIFSKEQIRYHKGKWFLFIYYFLKNKIEWNPIKIHT